MGKQKKRLIKAKMLIEENLKAQQKSKKCSFIYQKTQITQKHHQKRKSNDLFKLYEKGVIKQSQYVAGERLIRDHELSFKNKSFSDFENDPGVKVQKSNHNNVEFYLIQNLHAWDRYNSAIMSIQNKETREIVKMFCIDGLGLTEIDRRIGKRGVAEVRLWYGLGELVEHYKKLKGGSK